MSTGTVGLPRNSGWGRVTQACAPKPSLAGQKGLIFPYIPSASPGKGHNQPLGKGVKAPALQSLPITRETEDLTQEYVAVTAVIVR